MFSHPLPFSSGTPITKLPVELLSYIFDISTHSFHGDVHDDAERSPPFTSQSVKQPTILSTVCRNWRWVALRTPSLWTSLCITAEMIEGSPNRPSYLNTNHITSYLALSHSYPVDILIDARDEDWDFVEPEIPSEYDVDFYTPPFSTMHMNTVISLLLPHISRWRSLSILTDTWAPMHAALTRINPSITSIGAPALESLTLMRCNDFVSFSPEFQPSDMKDPAFLNTGSHGFCLPAGHHILPGLYKKSSMNSSSGMVK